MFKTTASLPQSSWNKRRAYAAITCVGVNPVKLVVMVAGDDSDEISRRPNLRSLTDDERRTHTDGPDPLGNDRSSFSTNPLTRLL